MLFELFKDRGYFRGIKDQIIGRRVVLCESGYENEDRPFFCGDELTIKLIDGRMYHLEDDTGNCLVVLDKHIELV